MPWPLNSFRPSSSSPPRPSRPHPFPLPFFPNRPPLIFQLMVFQWNSGIYTFPSRPQQSSTLKETLESPATSANAQKPIRPFSSTMRKTMSARNTCNFGWFASKHRPELKTASTNIGSAKNARAFCLARRWIDSLRRLKRIAEQFA